MFGSTPKHMGSDPLYAGWRRFYADQPWKGRCQFEVPDAGAEAPASRTRPQVSLTAAVHLHEVRVFELEAGASAPAPDPRARVTDMHRFQHAAMAAQFEIRCTCADGGYARQAARAAFAEVDRLELQLSRFVENSDITRINHLLPGESAVVSFETMQCLRLASLIHLETGGAFDIALGTGFETLELLAEQFTVRGGPPSLRELPPSPFGLRRDESRATDQGFVGVRLDLGALGKGYAVDRIADVLEDWEINEVLIDAGSSSVLALEPPAGEEAWPLTISDPADSGAILARISARQRALGASGIRKSDHIVNPLTRAPVRSRQAAWVSAPRVALAAISRRADVDDSPTAVADALSTAFMISPVEEIAAYCETHPGLEVWILERNLTHFPAAAAPDNE